MPLEVLKAAQEGRLVVFAGAGISTESSRVFKETLYEDVAAELELKKPVQSDFPTLMSRYCAQTDGRRKLLEKIKYRLDYCEQFQGLYRTATRFHRQLASIHHIQEIFTTNWDDYFERECGATPIVSAEDFAFFNISSRKVFKLHGSISSYGSLVATNEDYRRCYSRLRGGLIGGYLKTVLATKVVVFIGYSFGDFDFNRIHRFLSQEMKGILPHTYIVTTGRAPSGFHEAAGTTAIQTDGTYFLSILRKHLEEKKLLFPEVQLGLVDMLDSLLRDCHKQSTDFFQKKKTPIALYNLFYQDGMSDSFDCLRFQSKNGLAYCPDHILRNIRSYKSLRKAYIQDKNYPTLAYVDGFLSGLHTMLYTPDNFQFPIFYLMGYGPVETLAELKKFLRKRPSYHKGADAMARKHFAEMLDPKSELIPQHRPFIFA
jgi:hypothetical protein